MPLCDRHYSSLVTWIQDNMEDESFSMPGLNGLITKALQLKVLRLVCTADVFSYVSLLIEELCLNCLIHSSHRGMSLYHGQDADPRGSGNYLTPSQAESTLVRYRNITNPNANHDPRNLPLHGDCR